MKPRDTDSLELFIAYLLRVGVLSAGALMLIGWIVEIDFTRNVFIQFATYRDLRLVDALRELYDGERWGVLISYLGMTVLILLPLVRVMMTLVIFVKNRDFILAGISALVLTGLVLSFALGFEL